MRRAALLAAACGAALAFAPPTSPTLRRRRSRRHAEASVDKKAERRRIVASPNFHRKIFKEVEQKVKDDLGEDFYSEAVTAVGNSPTRKIERGDMTLVLAEKWGLCWGAERAVEMAFAAVEKFPDKQAHITNEILHNPGVNQRLADANIEFVVQDGETMEKDWSKVGKDDLVILPAFGAKLDEMQMLDAKGVTIVDTTCPWVSKVWGVVDKHKARGMTSVIHGKYAHEEAIATASFADVFLIVKNEKEATFVCDYVVNGGTKEDFYAFFHPMAMSAGFDPDVHLDKIGLANQTTMYMKETKAVGRLFEKAQLKRWGPEELKDRYFEFDTICDATQERQDAISDMLTDEALGECPLHIVLVVGGFNSSNSAHLLEIPMLKGLTAYQIDGADRIRPDNSIEHRLMSGEVVVTKDWLPKGKVTIGITSGASTPDAYLEESIEAMSMVHAML